MTPDEKLAEHLRAKLDRLPPAARAKVTRQTQDSEVLEMISEAGAKRTVRAVPAGGWRPAGQGQAIQGPIPEPDAATAKRILAGADRIKD